MERQLINHCSEAIFFSPLPRPGTPLPRPLPSSESPTSPILPDGGYKKIQFRRSRLGTSFPLSNHPSHPSRSSPSRPSFPFRHLGSYVSLPRFHLPALFVFTSLSLRRCVFVSSVFLHSVEQMEAIETRGCSRENGPAAHGTRATEREKKKEIYHFHSIPPRKKEERGRERRKIKLFRCNRK